MGDTSLLDSPATDARGSTSSSAHSYNTSASERTGHDYKHGAMYETSGSAASAAVAMFLSSGESGSGSSGEDGTLSIQRVSLPMSEGLLRIPSQPKSDLWRRSSNGSRGSSSDSGEGGAGGIIYKDNGDEDGHVVEHDVLMAALRRAGIMTCERDDGCGPLGHVDLQQSSSRSITQGARESFPWGSEGATFSTISLDGNEHDYEDEQTGLEPGSMIASSSMLELMDFEDKESADERTARLVGIFRNERVMATAIQGIHLARRCNLDLCAGDSNGDLVRDDVIGAGHYGQVSVVKHESLGVTVAMKELAEVSNML